MNLSVGVRIPAYWCVLDWDRPWLFRLHELYVMVAILIVPG